MDWEPLKHFFPFVGVLRQPDTPRTVLERLIENGLVGVLASAVALYVNDAVQDQKLVAIASKVETIERRHDTDLGRLAEDLRRIDSKLDALLLANIEYKK